MRYIRPMFVGVMLGSVASMLFLSRGSSQQIMAKVKRTINLLNYVGQEMGLSGRRQG